MFTKQDRNLLKNILYRTRYSPILETYQIFLNDETVEEVKAGSYRFADGYLFLYEDEPDSTEDNVLAAFAPGQWRYIKKIETPPNSSQE